MKRSLIGLIVLIVLFNSSVSVAFTVDLAEQEKPKNIILLIGDGMGFSHIHITKLAYGRLNMEEFQNTAYGLTYSLSGEVTDSAAAGTELATGVMTYNRMVSTIKVNGKIVNLTTILEVAQELGKSTGLVTTTRITHATPAVFCAHVEHRKMEKEIARQLIEHRINVLMGGGKKEFDANTLKLARELGYKIIYTKKELEDVDGKYVLGLFAESHIPYVLDRDGNTPSLLDMTKKAIEILEKDSDGFFLMVEGGRIDHAAHANDIASVIAETKEFDDVVGYVLDYAKRRGDTLVIVVADHETGGLTVGVNYGRCIDFEKIKQIKRSVEYIAEEIKAGGDIKYTVKRYTGIELTESEVREIEERARSEKYGLVNALGEIISEKVGIRFSSHKHSGELVPLMAYGPGAEDIRGFLHHVDVAKFMAKKLLFGELDIPLNKIRITSDGKKGDINGDCTVDEIDAYLVLNHFLGEFVDTEIEKKVDMNNNGVIDLGDVLYLIE